MGIAAAMKPKTKYPPAGGFSAALLMTGEAELAVQQKPELLHVAGAEIVGFLPGDLNMVTHIRRRHHVGQQECRRGEGLDRFPANAGREGGVSRERARASVIGKLNVLRNAVA